MGSWDNAIPRGTVLYTVVWCYSAIYARLVLPCYRATVHCTVLYVNVGPEAER